MSLKSALLWIIALEKDLFTAALFSSYGERGGGGQGERTNKQVRSKPSSNMVCQRQVKVVAMVMEVETSIQEKKIELTQENRLLCKLIIPTLEEKKNLWKPPYPV